MVKPANIDVRKIVAKVIDTIHEDMAQAVTYIRTIPMTPRFWHGVICQVWASQSGVHWRHS